MSGEHRDHVHTSFLRPAGDFTKYQHTGDRPDPLTTLRAEVVRLRDEVEPWLRAPDMLARNVTAARRQALKEVLDLIDKQREQQ